MLQMAAKMEAQAKDIKRLRMELERTSLKKKEDIPEPSSFEGLPTRWVMQWMRVCVGALQEWMEKLQVGEPLTRPPDHVGGSSAGDSLPRDHVIAYRLVLCKSHTTYMMRNTARVGKEAKGRSPYASLNEARGRAGGWAATSTRRTSSSAKWAECWADQSRRVDPC